MEISLFIILYIIWIFLSLKKVIYISFQNLYFCLYDFQLNILSNYNKYF